MNFVRKKDYTLGGEFAYDEETKQQVVIMYTWEKVLEEGIFTYAKVIGKKEHGVYSTDLRNLVQIGVD